MEKLRDSNVLITDYKISRDLGITQQRVRNLRIKENLVYPISFDWKKELANCIRNAKYEEPNMVIDIPDPNVMIEIRNYLEEHGQYSDIRLNSRLLTVRVDFFPDLALEIENDTTKEKIIKNLKNMIKKEKKYNRINMDSVVSVQGLVDAGVALATIVPFLAANAGGLCQAISSLV